MSLKFESWIRRADWLCRYYSHVIRAAQNPVLLDERQVNAVGARTEVDLRLGAVFTRFQTLTLQLMGGDLEDRVVSYGRYQPQQQLSSKHLSHSYRIMSVPYSWFCCRSVFSCPEIRARKILEYQGCRTSWWHRRHLFLETTSFIWPNGCNYSLWEVPDSSNCQSIEAAEETNQ